MSLKCGITGITNTGKTTLFNCLSNTKAAANNFAFSSNKSNIGVIEVPDDRLYQLEKYQETEKVTSAIVDIIDIPGLTKGSSRGEGLGNKFLGDIRNCDALIHLLRCFDSPELAHIEGSVDPVRDKETVEIELQIKDMESIEKQIDKNEKEAKSGDKEVIKRLEVLKIYKEHLDSLQPARTAPVKDDDRKYVDELQLLSMKPVIYVCNVDEGSAVHGNHYVDEVKEAVKEENAEVIIIAALLEAEISELDDVEERQEFLGFAGLKEPGVNKLIRSAYSILNLQSFFTIGPKEIRAWTIKKGMNAQQAAGAVHSDIEKGFIRAEVTKYDDFIALGSEKACKEAGKLHVEGKNYIVQDADLLYFRFNV